MKIWGAVAIAGIVIGIIIGIGIYTLLQQKTSPSSPPSTITGIVDINGVIPEGSTLTLLQKEVGSTDAFRAFASSLSPKDGIEWVFSKASTNTSYEIQATLTKNEQILAQSSPITITAPAHNETLTLNILTQNETGTAVISGTISLNGYIPEDATIIIQGRRPGSTSWTTVANNLPARNNQFMSYTTAVSGQAYEVHGLLMHQGKQIGESEILSLTAPAENETLTINSDATPPVTPLPTTTTTTGQPTNAPTASTSTINGVIDFNGQAPANSRITIFERPSGTGSFQLAVDSITPLDGTTWSWNGAQAGQSYDMIAILKQKQTNGTDQDISNSNTVTIAAPATNQTLTINSGFSLPAAGGTISVACGTFTSSTQTWAATITYAPITNAQSYWLQIGLTNGGIEITNVTQNANNTASATVNETFQNGVTYFARYAYSTIPNLSANSSQFSPFSQTTSLRCAR